MVPSANCRYERKQYCFKTGFMDCSYYVIDNGARIHLETEKNGEIEN